MNELVKYRKQVTSQDGEDGIIEEIFKRLGIVKGHCVEFGAWDGKSLANTWDLWHNKKWQALLIECHDKRFSDLEKEYGVLTNLKLVHAMVEVDGENSLTNILKRADYPKDFDLLSIDIDSVDYYVWESLKEFTPKLVVIEYNPSIPPDMEIVDEIGAVEFGASAAALYKLAISKDYVLATCTRSNMFFVHKSIFPELKIESPSLKEAFCYDHIRYVIGSFRGRTFMSTTHKLPGHIQTNGLISFRALLPANLTEDQKKNLTPVLVHEVSWLQRNILTMPFILLFAKIYGFFHKLRSKE